MMTSVAAVSRISVLLVLASACSRVSRKGGDTATAAADSAPPAAVTTRDSVATPAVTPTVTPTPDPTRPAASPRGDSVTPTPSPRPTPSETVLTGRINAGGLASQPRTTLQVEGGPPTTLTGPLEPELRRLNAATVWVAGAPGGAAPNASFAVSRYEIVSIDGAKPVVGSVIAHDGATWLAAERDTVKLVSAPADLRDKVGAKVWIVGRRTGAELTPQTFGIIRDP
jgi:hypothetical protein